MKLETTIFAVALVLAPAFAAGCAAPSAAPEESVAETSEQGLTNVQIASSIEKAFTFFEGPKAELTTEMRSATLPRGVRSAVARERRKIFATLGESGLTSNDVEHMNVYAVYTTSSKRTLAGYALWVHANDGSQGQAYLVGFNSRAAVVTEKDDWYQDDQDWE